MTAHDPYASQTRSRAGGPANLANVTPSDDTDLPVVSQWIYLADGGAMTLTTAGGQTLTTPALNAGWHLIEASRIHATGTTASGIMVGW